MLEHKPAAESVRAVKNSQLFMLSRKNLLGLLADYPTFESTLRRVGNLRDHGRTNRRAVGKVASTHCTLLTAPTHSCVHTMLTVHRKREHHHPWASARGMK